MNKSKIRKMIEEAGEDREVQDRITDVICEVMEMLEEKDPKEYKEIEKKMYDDGMMALDGGFDKDMAEYIVDKIYEGNHMSKSDRLFTYQKAEQLAKQHNIKMDGFTMEDWYITLVMAESDFKELLGTNMDNYVKYARLWLNDKDAPNGGSCKLYDYLCYVAQVIDDEDSRNFDNGFDYDYDSNRVNGQYYGSYSYPRESYGNRMRSPMYYDQGNRNTNRMSRRGGYNGYNNYDGMDSYDDMRMYDGASRPSMGRSQRSYMRTGNRNRRMR